MSTTNRIDARFAALKTQNKKALIAYITAGYPDLNATRDLLDALPGAGVDVIELGVPFSDPMADGPVIQAAGAIAIQKGANLPRILELVTAFRQKHPDTPLVLMGDYNPFYSYGTSRLMGDASKAGVDGFIVPDLPPEEDAELSRPARDADMHVIRFAAPTTDEKRLPTVLKDAGGFLYFVSITGITGSTSADPQHLRKALDMIRQSTEMPIAIGFGVNTPEQAKAMAGIADGVIVGSAIIRAINAQTQEGTMPLSVDGQNSVIAFIKELADAVHSV